ncbi:hypothetical protein Leryth_011482 [Lithospermum erythrorhizon]|uniref:Uncharacterized protein n=1 Tax=Lithospermum erythrorhizon TaxID=34254 RepID=A0AAV3P5V2_LITER|nr:hypothetical protein Leryth_011482 [Lithospermum erythrorhizon]
MESSKSIGEAEKCESSESGWTMYIGSPMGNSEDDNNGDGEVDDKYEEESYDEAVNAYGKDDDSDDSMASDASSWPPNDGKYLEENKVVGRQGSKFKKPDIDVPVKKNRPESRKNKVRKNQQVGAKN